ncbi:hypothetical protein F5Y19DRAFT_440705 [Xylariaceae sp. FL1651]|nr:hypothetical protein F5Y19DRAFT_440705 [Xylariaceae sp. FL1651]
MTTMASQLTDSKMANSATMNSKGLAPGQQPDMWGTVITVKCGRCDVRMKDDTGTPANWIHPDLARRCKLDLEECKHQKFEDFNGNTFKVKHIVWFTWIGKRDDRTFYGWFYIAPEKSHIDVVLGSDFVDRNGRARDVCRPQPRVQPSHIFTLDEESVSKEENKVIDANRKKNDRDAEEAAARKEKKKSKQDKTKTDTTNRGNNMARATRKS